MGFCALSPPSTLRELPTQVAAYWLSLLKEPQRGYLYSQKPPTCDDLGFRGLGLHEGRGPGLYTSSSATRRIMHAEP